MKTIILILAFSNIAFTQNSKSTNSVNKVLDNLHLFAAEANAKKYINLFANDAVFFGTDISERWPIVEFRKYAIDRMSSGKGWTYFMKVWIHQGKGAYIFMPSCMNSMKK